MSTLRFNYLAALPELQATMRSLDKMAVDTGLDSKVKELIKMRSSQINGCAFCLDMHSRDARAIGETEQRLYTLSAWRETPYFTDAERAALELTEAVTLIANNHITDALYEKVRLHFTEEQYIGLIVSINVINSWNRIALSMALQPK